MRISQAEFRRSSCRQRTKRRVMLLLLCWSCCMQVDAAIDSCSKVVNLRQLILDSKDKFDQYVANDNNQVSSNSILLNRLVAQKGRKNKKTDRQTETKKTFFCLFWYHLLLFPTAC